MTEAGCSMLRKPGRPRGARMAVAHGQRLGIHHFAFLRALAQGVDAQQAASRYLTMDRLDERIVKTEMQRIKAQLVAHCQADTELSGLFAQLHFDAVVTISQIDLRSLPDDI
ncbi:MAG: hypothetical protein HC858_07455, partial [Brachymonas sp.]|nr:hypothetical protein [Brachymonas sp.]